MAIKVSAAQWMRSIFDTQRVGKGVKKAPKLPHTLGNFFPYLKRHFDTIFKVNAFTIIGNFPIVFFLYAMTGALNRTAAAPASYLFPTLYGTVQFGAGKYSPIWLALYGVHGVQGEMSIFTTATYVCFGLTALLFLTWGVVNTGTTYILRNLIKNEPVFFINDFFYAIKRNWKQAIPLGIIDLGILCLLGYNIVLGYYNQGTNMSSLILVSNTLLFFLYNIARYYLYMMLVTFDLSILKIYKNAIIFSMLGFKRNMPAFIGQALVIGLMYVLLGVFLPLPISLILMIVPGLCAYMGAYAAWPKIKEIMIDPYYDTTDDTDETEEPIFRDDIS